MQRQYIVKMIGNVSDWLSYAGGALIKVADSAGSTELFFPSIMCENIIFIPTLTHYLGKYTIYELKIMIILEVNDFLASSFTSQRPICGSQRYLGVSDS